MGYYKIKNITKSLAKRDMQKDKNLSITLNDGLFPSEKVIQSGSEVLIECMRLPTELQKLRVKGLVTIVEVSKNEFLSKLKESQKPKQVPVEKNEPKVTTTSKKSTSKSKSSSSKKTTTTTTTTTTISPDKED